MKTKFAICLLLSAICFFAPATTPAQTLTNTPIIASPAIDAFNFLSTPASNWMFASYGIFTKNDGGGIGIGASYTVNDFVGATLRLDRIGNDTFLPSGNFQLQAPVTLMGKLTVIPFAFTGIATPLNNEPGHDGVVGMFGIGAAVRLPAALKTRSRFLPDDVIYDYEIWTSYEGGQHRVGFLWKF